MNRLNGSVSCDIYADRDILYDRAKKWASGQDAQKEGRDKCKKRPDPLVLNDFQCYLENQYAKKLLQIY